jgi:hypothetical protein
MLLTQHYPVGAAAGWIGAVLAAILFAISWVLGAPKQSRVALELDRQEA